MAGRFITLEGGEGAGKSTLMQALGKRLEAAGREVVLTREPGGSHLGEKIRSILLDSQDAPAAEAELLLFLADRAEHVDKLILPALKKGADVICDRFTESTLAYQGYGRGIALKSLEPLCAFAARGLKPDLMLWLDVPPSVGFERAAGRGGSDRMERAGLEFHERVAKGFEALSAAPYAYRIDATGSAEEVELSAWSAVDSLI